MVTGDGDGGGGGCAWGLVVTLSAIGDCKHLFLQETNHAGVHSGFI